MLKPKLLDNDKKIIEEELLKLRQTLQMVKEQENFLMMKLSSDNNSTLTMKRAETQLTLHQTNQNYSSLLVID